jgi:hypothetical protein
MKVLFDLEEITDPREWSQTVADIDRIIKLRAEIQRRVPAHVKTRKQFQQYLAW